MVITSHRTLTAREQMPGDKPLGQIWGFFSNFSLGGPRALQT